MSDGGSFAYKVHLCLRDDPGSFIRVFTALRGDQLLLQILNDEMRKRKPRIDFHSFSVAPCTRFSKLPRFIASVMTELGMEKLSIIRKYKLHSLVFIYSNRKAADSSKEKDADKEACNPGKNSEKFVKAVIEMHACFRDRGFREKGGVEEKPNVVDRIIGLMLFLYEIFGSDGNQPDNRNNEGGTSNASATEECETSSDHFWDRDFRALIIGSPREKHTARSLRNREILRVKLVRGYAIRDNEQEAQQTIKRFPTTHQSRSIRSGGQEAQPTNIDNFCPARGTCPIAHACSGLTIDTAGHMRDFLGRLIECSTVCGVRDNGGCPSIRDKGGNSDKSKAEDLLTKYICDTYFIRDHEDYTPFRSYMEIYGRCHKNPDKPGGTSKGQDQGGGGKGGSTKDDVKKKYIRRFLNALNIITLSIITHKESGGKNQRGASRNESIASYYTKRIMDKLNDPYISGLGEQIRVVPVDERRVIVFNKYFSCDDIRCDINRIIKYVPDLR